MALVELIFRKFWCQSAHAAVMTSVSNIRKTCLASAEVPWDNLSIHQALLMTGGKQLTHDVLGFSRGAMGQPQHPSNASAPSFPLQS